MKPKEILIAISSILIISNCFINSNQQQFKQIKFLSESVNEINNQIELQSYLNLKASDKVDLSKLNNQPIAVFHGVGDNCGGWMSDWTNYFGSVANSYAKCIESGADKVSETTNIITQAQKACQLINQDENYNGNFTIVAFSQGGLIARYILEQCKMKGKVTKLITFGTPHMGISKIPFCNGNEQKLYCKFLDSLINIVAFIPFVNNFYTPLSYLNPPLMYDLYRKYGSYLSVINNEAYDQKFFNNNKSRFESLEKLVLIKFREDDIVFPRESAWFQKYNKHLEVQSLEKSEFYQQDFLGLKKLNDAGKVSFVEFRGKHMQLYKDEIDKFVVPVLLE